MISEKNIPRDKSLTIIYVVFIILIIGSLGMFFIPFFLSILWQEPPFPHYLFIDIDSNDDFDNFGFPGSGTDVDPYIIENYTFEDNLISITISNVNNYFVIRNNIISSDYQDSILISNVGENRTKILNNFILGNAYRFNSYDGIRIINSDGCLIANNTIQNRDNGLRILSSDNCHVLHNTFQYSFTNLKIADSANTTIDENIFVFIEKGFNPQAASIDLDNSVNSTITNNSFKDNGLWFDSNCLSGLKITNNSINNKSICFLTHQDGLIFNDTTLYDQIILFNCSNVKFKGLSFTKTSVAINLMHCSQVNITDCEFVKNHYSGVYTSDCADLFINESTFDSCYIGIRLYYSDSVLIQENIFMNNFYGIFEGSFSNATYIDNTFINNSFDF